MKFHTTQREIKANYPRIIKVGYCSLQALLSFENPIAYTTRREGWGCDIYQVSQNTAISTGYAPFGNICPKYETINKYEYRAIEIIYSDEPYDERKAALRKLIAEFIEEVCA